uniref:Phospholipase/carboxylesterase/thioesterase domain-containing protein n=1 Tax=Chromera velia CCMP2878 TaxID=1169474 RepID=A0A0G4H2F0_9ALVE|mmetsp:Transcript_16984/g.34455  ORF Transcript_16984/g.34455 Transcript_16984/m.34455 type:complete len:293 (-) Transcript_16984:207-1085(-)|eukprot:Cvel_24408.t1-p1 / transcript=Cvel_24408.t1 / gene=Cvel_24408 / organism=Chromera_velia_CCMP2878 / gene_product=hypothetical protein / transcript_product=hypothetical protein / location=Cvel_scaffold2634:18812-23131(+) / protein_length=292 / sequence_SO=supercontig / SO=protein_coding / is_pseudo=false
MASLKQMRSFLASKGVNVQALLEKPEILSAYDDCLKGLGSFHRFEKNVGGLDSIVITNSPKPQALVAIFHGFGANGADLAPLSDYFLRESKRAGVPMAAVVPDAPLDMGGGSRAWWIIDLMRLQSLIMSMKFDEIKKDVPQGLTEARGSAAACVAAACAMWNLPMSRVALGGFSQGSMVAVDAVLHMKEKPASLGIWSGCLIAEDVWSSKMKETGGGEALSKTSVVQSHGKQDMVLPYMAGQWLKEFLNGCGVQHEFLDFNGAHGCFPPAVERQATLFADQVARDLKAAEGG